MTTLRITVEDENAGMLKKLLQEVSFVKSIEEEKVIKNDTSGDESSLERIKKILDEVKEKNLFKDIEDPVEWQRNVRKEWDRDF
ncbi:hypothetical protein [Mucilaginibacter sp.]|uniref:hypothetical protein n=1 Tax=Mucilaginibacter sp. TaxID=1882438 RepID=UPI0028519650|nr:hypothetical protein [Mucilaginibacter sp.]MDR3693967.1 hypothetical protein [Mucilaginibacter sp.]